MKAPLKAILFFLIPALYGLLLAVVPNAWYTVLVGIAPAVVASNVVHELSHLLCYRLFGLKWIRLRIGPLSVSAEGGKLQWQLDWSSSAFRGECACQYDESISTWKYIVSLLSGGICCGVCAALLLCFRAVEGTAGSSLGLSLGIGFSCNAIVNLVSPFSADLRLIGAVLTKGKERK